MKIVTLDSLEALSQYFSFTKRGQVLEFGEAFRTPGENLEEFRKMDARVLCHMAANGSGDYLEIGTSYGHGTFKLATNNPSGTVHTVNLLPEQFSTPGTLPTHLITKDEIGSFYRKYGVTNVVQHYVNSISWEMPDSIRDLGLVFIDGDHDERMVCADTLRLYPRIRPGGFLLWHDFNPELRSSLGWIDQSMRGVEWALKELRLDPEIVNVRGSWVGILRKPEEAADQRAAQRPPVEVSTRPRIEVSVVQPQPVALKRDVKSLKTVWAYGAWDDKCVPREEGFVKRMQALGYDVVGFPLWCQGGWWPFPKLDQAYRAGTPELRKLYSDLATTLEGRDVLIAAGGSMLHPDFVSKLSAYTVFYCGDDPESSDHLSRPAAPAFDCACPTNVACVDLYRTWGCRRVEWVYHGLEVDPTINEERIRNGFRDLDVSIFCERVYNISDRAQRVEYLFKHFPQAIVRGRGWPAGPAPEIEGYLKRTKIGWNLHNSIGPTNSRCVQLPLLGVMQICDNKSHLGQLFELDREVVGFETLDECVDKTRYYLAHEQERIEIAVRGWKRACRDYKEENMLANLIRPALEGKNPSVRAPVSAPTLVLQL